MRHIQPNFLDFRLLSHLELYRLFGIFPVIPSAVLIVLVLTSAIFLIYSNSLDLESMYEQNFFNFHLIQHQSMDIYEGKDQINIPFHQLRDFRDITHHFHNLFFTLKNLNSIDFVPQNNTQEQILTHPQNLTCHFRNRSVVSQTFTLQNGLPLLNDPSDLKSILNQAAKLLLEFSLGKQRKLKLEYDLNPYSMTVHIFEDTYTWLYPNNQKNLTVVRKKHSRKRNIQISPHLLQILLIISSITLLYFQVQLIGMIISEYERSIQNHSTDNYNSSILISQEYADRTTSVESQQGKLENLLRKNRPFNRLKYTDKLQVIGLWNIIVGGLAALHLITQLAFFLRKTEQNEIHIQLMVMCICAFGMLMSLFDNLQHYLIVNHILKRGIKLAWSLLPFIVIFVTGFVLTFHVMCPRLFKWQSIYLGHFQLLFNNFQYGIYQNFMALGKSGVIPLFLYIIYLFIMVQTVNVLLMTLFCQLVLERQREKAVLQLVRRLTPKCPSCGMVQIAPSQRREVEIVAGLRLETSKDDMWIRAQPGQLISSPKIRSPSPNQRINQSPYSIQPQRQAAKYRVLQLKINRVIEQLEECSQQGCLNAKAVQSLQEIRRRIRSASS